MAKAKFVVVGKGAREHCLVEILKERGQVFSFGGSDKIREVAEPLDKEKPYSLSQPLEEKGLEQLLCQEDSVILFGPEEPLVQGWVDKILEKAPHHRVLGPRKRIAQLEGSKNFAKEFLKRHGIPTPSHVYVETLEEVAGNLEKFSPPYVVKADGLARGKGVGVFHSKEEALSFAEAILVKKIYGEQKGCLLEEYQQGSEVSLFLLLDGRNGLQLGMVRDYKRLLDQDKGPNTGGMGGFFPPPDISPKDEMEIYRRIVRPLLYGLCQENMMYPGFLYLGLIKTNKGFQVLEINVRLGDPEAQVLLPLMKGQFADFCLRASEGELVTVGDEENVIQMDSHIWWYQPEGASVTVVLASPGYPTQPEKGIPLPGIEEKVRTLPDYVHIFHGATRKEGGRWVTDGGRVLSITVVHPDLTVARQKCYEAISTLGLTSLYYRQDIAQVGVRRAYPMVIRHPLVACLTDWEEGREDLLLCQEWLQNFSIPSSFHFFSFRLSLEEMKKALQDIAKNKTALLVYSPSETLPCFLADQVLLPVLWVSSQEHGRLFSKRPIAYFGEKKQGLKRAVLFLATLLAPQFAPVAERLNSYYRELREQEKGSLFQGTEVK